VHVAETQLRHELRAAELTIANNSRLAADVSRSRSRDSHDSLTRGSSKARYECVYVCERNNCVWGGGGGD